LTDLNGEKQAQHIIRGQPGLVGFYVTTMAFNTALSIADKIKQISPTIKTIFGGPHVTALPDLTMQNLAVDFICKGEGEYLMLDLVKVLAAKGDDFSNILGLSWQRNGVPIHNPMRPPIMDLDSLPFPARHLLPDISQYRPASIYWRRLPSLHIYTTRGCPHKCIFCQSSQLAPGNVFGRRVRSHSVDYSISEIDHLIRNYHVKEVIINDDTFNINKRRVYNFCESMMKKGLHRKIEWSCNIQVRSRAVDKDMLKMMRQAGCWQIMPGFESGDQEILNLIKKGITLEESMNVSRWAREVGLIIKANFILGHPMETRESVMKTIDFAHKIKAHFVSFTLMSPLPGTELYNMAPDYGLTNPMDFDSVAFSGSSEHIPFVPKDLTEAEVRRYLDKAYRSTYLNPRVVFENVKALRSWAGVTTYFQALLTLLFLKGPGSKK
jgi:radical SAM superfamily enzyme YgiQ (UPF0313 family)